jgi:hypothetical protein
MSLAPDYVEPVVGWRVWLVVGEREAFRLRSVVYEALWLPGRELVARCLHRALLLRFPTRRRSEHSPPFARCHCGIYGASELEKAVSYLDVLGRSEKFALHRVLGKVSLWGEVLECEQGWRASHAYPAAIYVPTKGHPHRLRVQAAEEIALSLTEYGVPVELLDCATPEEAVAALGSADTGSEAPGVSR